MNTFWITFYSYKGGVGRTMALANVAAMLAKDGRRVLLIDFDLEAPGLDAFEGLGCAKSQPGVVEYVSEYLATGKAPDVRPFVQECVPDTHLRGKLWLMSSGRKDHAYNTQRAQINWTDLYDKFDGQRFIENWKAEIERVYAPDFVFVDSRTGLTDVGGVCTVQIPHLVVLIFALNDQNLQGISSVARVISKTDNPRSPQLLTVASPVPPMSVDSEQLEQRLVSAEKELGIKPHCQIHYDPRVALKEQILVWHDIHPVAFELTRRQGMPFSAGIGSRLTHEYILLRDKILEYDVRGLDFLINQATRAIGELDEQVAKEAVDALVREYPDRAECYYQIAQVSRAFGRIDNVESALLKAFQVDPLFSPAATELVNLLKVKKRYSEAIALMKKRCDAAIAAKDIQVGRFLCDELGQLCMTGGGYADAVHAYELRSKILGDDQHTRALATQFNYMEARRRAGQNVPESDIREVVSTYERGAATEGAGPAVIRLNQLQAMHIPYALLGDVQRAQSLLQQVQSLALGVSPLDRVFSVITYTDVPIEDFLKETAEMLDALRNGQLWDGTSLGASISM